MLSVLVSATAGYLTVPARAGQSEQPLGVRTGSTLFLRPVDGDTTCSYRWPPRVIYNTDGNWVFNYLPNRCPEKLTGIMEALKDTSVDVISVLVGIDDDLSWRGSPYGELFGDATSIWAADGDPNKAAVGGLTIGAVQLLHQNLVAVIEDGHDLMQIYVKHGHQMGKGMYAAFRMNDAHANDERRSWNQRSKQKQSRPDLLIGSPAPRGVSGHADEWKFSWQWDYAQEEVRQRFLGLFNETLERYDFDGLELDFCRAPLLFKPGQAYKHVDTLTEFVRQARDIVMKQQEKKDKPIRLLVRVPTSIDHSMGLGIDTLRWIHEGLVDIIVLSSAYSCTLQMDVEKAVSQAASQKVHVYSGFDSTTYKVSPQQGFDWNPQSVMRAVALNGYQQGATGVYLFNYDYASHRQGPVSEKEPRVADSSDHRAGRFTAADLQVLRDLGDPDALRKQDRCYYLDGGGSFGDFMVQVPRKLALLGRGSGVQHECELKISDDLDGGLRSGRIVNIELRLRLTDYEKERDRIRCRINGSVVELTNARTVSNSSGQEWLILDNPPVQKGVNRISVMLTGIRTPEPWPTLHQCEIIVRCRQP